MAKAGVNCVQIVVTWYQKSVDSVKIKRVSEKTPTDSSLIHAIRKAHEYGMAVMLKPHVDLINTDGYWRGDIYCHKESDWRKWFAQYKKFIKHYARIAEKEKVAIFCVGTELSEVVFRKKEVWRDCLIPEIKKIFSGALTYAANWDAYTDVDFWDLLDYAGIDAYFPLAETVSPSLEDLKKGWGKWLLEIESWQEKIKKPVIFTECGYPSADTAAKRPWETPVRGVPNLSIQADCYRSLLETFCGKPWFLGLYWWRWDIHGRSGGQRARDFTPRNKPALSHVKLWYASVDNSALPARSKLQDL